MANAVKTLTDVIRKGVKKSDTGGITVKPNYIKLIERDDVTEEEMAAQANSYADSLYNDSINEVKSEAARKLDALDQKLNETTRKNGLKQAKTAQDYKDAMEANVDSAIRQGVVNSSIYEGMKERTTEEYKTKMQDLEDSLAGATTTIKREEEVIIKARDVALTNYEIKRAAEYEKKLQQLRAIEYKARESVRKKNEILSKLIADYEKNARIAQEEWEDARRKGQI